MLVSGTAPESIFIIAGVGRTHRVLSELLRNSRIFLLLIPILGRCPQPAVATEFYD